MKVKNRRKREGERDTDRVESVTDRESKRAIMREEERTTVTKR